MKKSPDFEAKRSRAAAKIKDVAPHIDTLIAVLDETRVDLILIALCGETLPGEKEYPTCQSAGNGSVYSPADRSAPSQKGTGRRRDE